MDTRGVRRYFSFTWACRLWFGSNSFTLAVRKFIMEAFWLNEICHQKIITLVRKHLFKVCPPLPRAIFCKESRGDVRIARNCYFTKFPKIGQNVLRAKKGVKLINT